MHGTVLRIEKSSIFDGAGLRTVVFLKGCPLSCLWCSTPESQSPQIETVKNEKKAPSSEEIRYGELLSSEQVVREIMKDEIFYFQSGGGVTLSGGEPLAQPEFAREILQGVRAMGVHTAMETCGYAPWENLLLLAPLLDTVFYDIKHMDPARHLELCGADNTLILENIRRLDALDLPLEICVRIPLIPTLNDSDENLRQTATLAKSLRKISGLEILPYHRLGTDTYRLLGRPYALADLPAPSEEWLVNRLAFLKELELSFPLLSGTASY